MAEAPAAVQFAEPVAAADEPLTRMLSSQRPPPSPFEDVPLAGPSAEGAQASAAEAAGDEEEVLPKTRSPRGLAPTKSALKISKDKEAGNGSADAQPGRGLTWADTHGRVRCGCLLVAAAVPAVLHGRYGWRGFAGPQPLCCLPLGFCCIQHLALLS